MKNADRKIALELYYDKVELKTADVQRLFGCSSDTARRAKKAVREEMAKRHMRTWAENIVNTKVAYEVWGIDVEDCERREKKLEQLRRAGLIDGT